MKKTGNEKTAKEVKTENKLTELVFILDKSGSMSGLESDTIGGFNSMLKKQREHGEGKVLVTTVLFSSENVMIHERRPLEEVPDLTDSDYSVGGCTALIDAIGETVKYVDRAHKKASPEEIPDNVLFVITTDGEENASREYSSDAVKRMLKAKQKLGWEFLFMAANIDAVQTASHFGIKKDRAVNYVADSKGTGNNFMALGKAVECMRSCGSVGDEWKEMVDDDYNGRKNGG